MKGSSTGGSGSSLGAGPKYEISSLVESDRSSRSARSIVFWMRGVLSSGLQSDQLFLGRDEHCAPNFEAIYHQGRDD
ncbi:unnamed protein product [Prunus armeniaca]